MGSDRSGVTSERRKFHEAAARPAGSPARDRGAVAGEGGAPESIPGAPQEAHTGSRLAFGPYVLDPETGRLMEGERLIPLAPKPFETLHYLAQRGGRVVGKGELMEALWTGTFVTDDVLVQSIVEIRRALGDQAKTPQYIETIPRKGYRFLPEVRAAAVAAPPVTAPAAAAEAPSIPAPAVPAGRGRRRAWLLLALALAAAAGVGMWRGRRPEPRPAARAAPDPGSLVVLPLRVEEPAPESGWLRQGLAEMIAAQLGQTPGVHVVARHRLAAALSEAGYDEGREPSAAAAAEVAGALAAETLITGSYVRVGDDFVLDAQLVDVASGRSVGAASVRGRHPGGVLDAVDEVCRRLAPSLARAARAEDAGAGAWRPARLTTRSVEASKHYVEALAAAAGGGREGAEQAEARLDQALALDPAFAQAHVKKAEIQHWRRRWGYGDPDPAPAVRAAVRLTADLPERDRLMVRGFEALILKGQPAAALQAWNAMLQFYPTYAEELGVPGLVAEACVAQGRWDQVIVVAQAHGGSPSLPDAERARLASLLAQAYRRKGELERALEEARRALRLWPGRAGPAFLRQRALFGRIALDAGQWQDALHAFEAVAAAPEADPPSLTDAAWGLYMAGDPARAWALVSRALERDGTYGNAFHLRGWLALARGDFQAAAQDLTLAFERTSQHFGSPHQGAAHGDLAALYYAGVARQKQGAREAARATFGRLIERCRGIAARSRGGDEDPAVRWQAQSFLARAAARVGLPAPEPGRLEGDDMTHFVQSARLHALQGRREQALRELAQGMALGHAEHRHVADDPDFESLRAEPEFQRLTRPAHRLPEAR